MALRSRSLFLYGYQVTVQNNAIDFKNSGGGTVIQATLRLGYYSLTSLLNEIARAMNAADPTQNYFATADRTFSSGLQNRVSIGTTGSFLSLLFLTGPRTSSSVAPLIGFTVADRVGSVSYQGTSTSGVILTPDYVGYNYLGPTNYKKVFGNLNISASGVKEAVVFQVQEFLQVQFKYEPESKISVWEDLMEWMITQKEFDFTPDSSNPSLFYNVTLETSSDDGKGLGFKMTEMVPQFPFFYDTGMMKFRRIV